MNAVMREQQLPKSRSKSRKRQVIEQTAEDRFREIKPKAPSNRDRKVYKQ